MRSPTAAAAARFLFRVPAHLVQAVLGKGELPPMIVLKWFRSVAVQLAVDHPPAVLRVENGRRPVVLVLGDPLDPLLARVLAPVAELLVAAGEPPADKYL